MTYCFIGPLTFECQILERRRVGNPRYQIEAGLADPRPDPVDEAELPDRRVDRLLGDELLHLVEDRGALLVIELVGLLRIELVDIRIAAIGKSAVLDHKRRHPGRRVAERAARGLDDPALVLLGAVAGVESGALDRL